VYLGAASLDATFRLLTRLFVEESHTSPIQLGKASLVFRVKHSFPGNLLLSTLRARHEKDNVPRWQTRIAPSMPVRQGRAFMDSGLLERPRWQAFALPRQLACGARFC
jgi:hypothetical protein